MDTNKLKLKLEQKRNETASSLVNLNSEDIIANFRYLQGYLHSLDAVLLCIREMESEEFNDD